MSDFVRGRHEELADLAVLRYLVPNHSATVKGECVVITRPSAPHGQADATTRRPNQTLPEPSFDPPAKLIADIRAAVVEKGTPIAKLRLVLMERRCRTM